MKMSTVPSDEVIHDDGSPMRNKSIQNCSLSIEEEEESKLQVDMSRCNVSPYSAFETRQGSYEKPISPAGVGIMDQDVYRNH